MDKFLYRILDESKQFEIEWISEMKKPGEMKGEYSDLEFDEKEGFSLKKLSDESVLNVAHTKGLTVRKTLDDLAPGVESEVAYIPNSGMAVETASMEEYTSFANEMKTSSKKQKSSEKKQEEKQKASEKKEETTKEEKKAESAKEENKDTSKEKKEEEQSKDRNAIKKHERQLDLLTGPELQSVDVYKRIDSDQYDKTMDMIMNKAVRRGFIMIQDLPQDARELYDLDNTLSDVNSIKSLLLALEDNSYIRKNKDHDLAVARLSAVQGRNLSHLMLNDKKLFGDSKEMKKVKKAVSELELFLTSVKERTITDREMDQIAELYRTAMNECQKYCVFCGRRRFISFMRFMTGQWIKSRIKVTVSRMIS